MGNPLQNKAVVEYNSAVLRCGSVLVCCGN